MSKERIWKSIKKHGLSVAGAGLLLAAGVREVITPAVVSAEVLRPDFGISLNCDTGATTVWMKDYGFRRLVLEMNNISADKKGIIGEVKPENQVGIGVGGQWEISSNNGKIPVQKGDTVQLKALQPAEEPEEVGRKTIEVVCN